MEKNLEYTSSNSTQVELLNVSNKNILDEYQNDLECISGDSRDEYEHVCSVCRKHFTSNDPNQDTCYKCLLEFADLID